MVIILITPITNSLEPGNQDTNPTTTTNALSLPTTHDLEVRDTSSSPKQEPASTYDQANISTTTAKHFTTSTSQEALDYLPYAVGGAVGATVVIIAIVLIVVIVSLLVRRSRKKSYKVEPNKDIGLLSYNNAMYDVGKETNTCSAQKWQLHFPVCMARDHLLVLYMCSLLYMYG